MALANDDAALRRRMEDAFLDAQDIALDVERFTDEMMAPDANEYGVDLRLAAIQYVDTYAGSNNFVNNMKKTLLAYKGMTNPQCRAVLNILREELLKDGQVKRDRLITCFDHNTVFQTQEEYDKHIDEVHKGIVNYVYSPVDGTEAPGERVVANTTSKLKLDLTALPDGRYAVPDMTGKNDYCFIMVKRIRTRKFRDRRYSYGKIITGREWIEAGTIEVKEWSSDQKRLCGEQKPGKFYEGEFELELSMVLPAPMPWAVLFGKYIGCCGICGKTLTDDISRYDGFGPECIKKIDEGYFTRERKPQFTLEEGKVYCLQHKQYNCGLKHSFDDLEGVL